LYVNCCDKWLRVVSVKCLTDMHRPLLEQLFSHFNRSQAIPVYPSWHRQLPVDVSQWPRPEHTAFACAVSVELAMSLNAGADGQTRSEQSPPENPSAHPHTELLLQFPFREQLFGHPKAVRGTIYHSVSCRSTLIWQQCPSASIRNYRCERF